MRGVGALEALRVEDVVARGRRDRLDLHEPATWIVSSAYNVHSIVIYTPRPAAWASAPLARIPGAKATRTRTRTRTKKSSRTHRLLVTFRITLCARTTTTKESKSTAYPPRPAGVSARSTQQHTSIARERRLAQCRAQSEGACRQHVYSIPCLFLDECSTSALVRGAAGGEGMVRVGGGGERSNQTPPLGIPGPARGYSRDYCSGMPTANHGSWIICRCLSGDKHLRNTSCQRPMVSKLIVQNIIVWLPCWSGRCLVHRSRSSLDLRLNPCSIYSPAHLFPSHSRMQQMDPVCLSKQ